MSMKLTIPGKLRRATGDERGRNGLRRRGVFNPWVKVVLGQSYFSLPLCSGRTPTLIALGLILHVELKGD